jgi:hypothetical protein
MKKRNILFVFVMLLSVCGITSCHRTGCTDVNACNYDAKAKVTDGSCIDKGKVIFWKSTAGGTADITVTINSTEGTVTTQQTSIPACDAAGCATFTLCPGSYHYEASSGILGENWEGNAVITEDGCLTVQLD